MLLDDRMDLTSHLRGRLRRLDQPHTLGLGAVDLQIAPAHPAVKRELLALEVIETPAADPPEALLGRQIEEQGQIGQEAAGGVHVQLTNEVEIDTPSVSLVGEGGIRVPVTQHDAAPREPGADLLRHVLPARGHEQEDLDQRLGTDARTLEQAPDGRTESGAVGLAGPLHAVTLAAEGALETQHLRGLARPLHTFERDQTSAHESDSSMAPFRARALPAQGTQSPLRVRAREAGRSGGGRCRPGVRRTPARERTGRRRPAPADPRATEPGTAASARPRRTPAAAPPEARRR